MNRAEALEFSTWKPSTVAKSTVASCAGDMLSAKVERSFRIWALYGVSTATLRAAPG